MTDNLNNTKPYPSWEWKDINYTNENGIDNVIGGYWDSPKAMPTINKKIFTWNEELLDWVEVI
jgi:hypothetical protein